jgi:hypothetical protein
MSSKYDSILISSDLKKGPIKLRNCTDIIFLIIFLLHLLALLGLGIAALSTGDASKLTSGQDFYGDFCGAKKSSSGRLDSLESYSKVLYTTNVDSTTELSAKSILENGLTSS